MTIRLACLVVAFSPCVFGQNLIPELHPFREAKLTLWGYTQTQYTEQSDQDDFAWTHLRFFSDLTMGSWKIKTESEGVGFDDAHSNWLRQLFAEYAFSDDLQVRAGRLFLSAGYITPPLFLLETVSYPESIDFNLYGWGAQVEKKFDHGWLVLADVTANSHSAFDSSESWSGLESSARVEKSFGWWSLAATNQISQDDERVALDVTVTPNDAWTVKTAGFTRFDFADTDSVGGYAYAGYKPWSWLELHAQCDGGLELGEPNNAFITLAPGARLIGKNDQFSLTVDYLFSLKGDQDDALLARFQFRF